MTGCESMFVHLNDVVDGELAAEDRQTVEQHLKQCPACRAELEGLKALKGMTLALPEEMATDRDLWPEIDAKIDVASRRPVWRRYQVLAAAAVLIVAVGVPWVMTRNQQDAGTTAQQTKAPEGIAEANYEPASVDSFREEYRQARAELQRVVNEKRSALSPETLTVIEGNLELIDHAIEEIESALAANPGAKPLDRQLRLAYRQQIEVLRWAAHLAA